MLLKRAGVLLRSTPHKKGSVLTVCADRAGLCAIDVGEVPVAVFIFTVAPPVPLEGPRKTAVLGTAVNVGQRRVACAGTAQRWSVGNHWGSAAESPARL